LYKSEAAIQWERTLEISHRFIQSNGIKMQIAEAGEGPLVVLCHGWPESWYSWRHQLKALAAAGYHAVAPDMRGYGQTDKPEAIDQYTLFHLTGDMVGVVGALGQKEAAIVGHDWGAPVAWFSALFRPDVFKAVAGLSVPFRPRGNVRPTTAMPQTDKAIFYQLYFQEPGIAEGELEKDVRHSVRATLFGGFTSPDGDSTTVGMLPREGGFLTDRKPPDVSPSWITETDIDFYANELRQSGFRGGLNWYRNIDRNWELLAPWSGAKISVPALYIAGERDLVVRFRGMDKLIPNLAQFVPDLRGTYLLHGCGHWTQQERAEEVNNALIKFLNGLRPQTFA
jgi:pimeloyl-ACP methyl ester carboxylesterase